MDNYKEELINYSKWLKERENIIKKITYKSQRNYNIINNPQSIEEINLAKAIINILTDIRDIIHNKEEYEIVPIEDNKTIKLYIEIINRLKNNNPYIDLIEEYKEDNKTIASFIYDLLQISNYYDKVEEYIRDNSGFEPFDEEFKKYYNQALSIINSNIDLSNYDTDRIEQIIDLSKEIHILKSIKNKQSKQYNKLK